MYTPSVGPPVGRDNLCCRPTGGPPEGLKRCANAHSTFSGPVRQDISSTAFLGGLECKQGDLWRAVETEGKPYGADAAVDVELHLVEAIVAPRIFFAHGRQDEGSDKGQADLAAVGVAGEHEVDEWAAGVGSDDVGVVGLVRHEDDGCVGFGGDGEVEVGMAGAGVVDATEPDAGSVAVDGEELIDQDGGAFAGEGADDHGGVNGDVVVAEDGVAQGGGDGGEDLGAAVGGVIGVEEGKGAVGDEVSGEEDEVGGERVDLVDDAFEEEGFGVLVEVNVADLNDAVAVEGGGQVGDGDGVGNDVDLVARDFGGVECHGGGRDA